MGPRQGLGQGVVGELNRMEGLDTDWRSKVSIH